MTATLVPQAGGAIEPAESALLCVLLLRGAQTPGELRQRSQTLPIIVASGMGHEKFVTDLRELGVPTFLKKPFAAEELLKSLHAELHPEAAAAVA